MKIEYSDMIKRLPKQFFATLVGKVNALANEGHDIINLGQGNPDGMTPVNIVEKLQEEAANPKFHRYSPFTGYSFVKEAISSFYKREYGVEIDSEHEVAVLFGGKAGLVEISQCLLNEGDTCLVPDPGYPDYMSGIAMAKAKPYPMPLLEVNNYLPDYNQIDKTTLEKAKMMFLNYPNNPTGAIATKEFFEETVHLANNYNIAVVHDFAYGSIGFDGKKPISFLQTNGAKDVGIEIYTLSKTFNMAGWRIAFAVGNPEIIKVINLIQDHYYVSLFGAIQAAAAEALLGPQEAVKSITANYESRRDIFFDALAKIGWKAEKNAGSFFVWLPVPNGYTSEEIADILLEKAHVAVAPGVGFGKYGEGYIRVGLLASEERLLEAVERIEKLHLF